MFFFFGLLGYTQTVNLILFFLEISYKVGPPPVINWLYTHEYYSYSMFTIVFHWSY
jgi:hypothetical protein